MYEMGSTATIDTVPSETSGPEVDALETELAEVAGLANAVNGRLVELVIAALDTGVWCQSGVHSPAQWVAWQCGVSGGRARQLVRVAKRLPELPACRAALAAGSLSLDQAATIAAHAPAWADEEVTELAKKLTVTQLARTLRHYSFDSPKPAPSDPDTEAATEHRRVSFGPVSDDTWEMHVHLPIDEGAAIEQALTATRDDLFHDRHGQNPDSGHDPGDISWADALLEICERALTAGAVARPHADRHRVLWHHEIDPAGNPILTPPEGGPLPSTLRRLYLCDATITPVWELGGIPVNLGRSERIVPRRIRRLIEHRDGGCRVPGCDRGRWVQVHHIVHWEDGGVTDTHNLICLCPHHHRLHHQGMLGIEGNADKPGGITFTDRHGRNIPSARGPSPPTETPTAEARRHGINTPEWQHPLGEHLDNWSIHFNPPTA